MSLVIILKSVTRTKTKYLKSGLKTDISQWERYITQELKEYEAKILGRRKILI